MAAQALPRAPGGASPAADPTAATPVVAAPVDPESASESTPKRLQTSGNTAETTTTTTGSTDGETDESTTAVLEEGDNEGPEQAAERVASHLDMLAETVRSIVTRVMQPTTTGPSTAETDATDPGVVAAADGDDLAAGGAVVPTASGRTEYSLEVREQCVAKHAAGSSYKTIAAEMGMPMTSVQTIVKRAKQQGGVVTVAQRAGRPRVTDESVETTIRAIVTRQPQLSAREVLDQVMLTHKGITVSFETIRRRVRECRKQLNGTVEASSPAPPRAPEPALTFQQQLRASFQQHQQQQAQLGGSDEDEDLDIDADLYDDDGDAGEPRSGPMDSAATDTEAETSTSTAASSTTRKTGAAGKTRRKRGSEYSPEFREMCVQMHERDGKSYQAIATELDIPPDSVRAIVRKAKRTGSVVTAPRSGRPRKTTDLIDRVILQSVKNSQRSTAKQIQDDLWSIYQVKVSCETIRRRVRDHTKQRLQIVDSTAVPPTLPQGPDPTPAVIAPIVPAASATAPAPVPERSIPQMVPGSDVTHTAVAATPSPERDSVVPPPTTRSLKRKRTEYSLDVRERCVALHNEGLGFRKIGEQLNMPHTTVRAIVEKVQRTGSMLPAPRSGRPRKTDEILDKVILQTVKANAKCSARMIQQELESAFDVKVSCETIRRRVKDYMRQKHLFAESSPLTMVASEADTAMDQSDAPSQRRRALPLPEPVEEPVAPPSTTLAEQLELQRQQQEHQRQQQAQAQQQREQHESMLLMAEITQPFHSVHPHDGMVTSANDVRAVPQSLMEMMTAAAAAAAAVSSHHHHPHQHLSYQPPPHQLPLMPVPYGFGFVPQLHQPHAQAMQAMLDEALGTQPLETSHPHHHPHPHHQQHQQAPPHHQLQPPSQPPPPPSPSPMSEFVL